MASWPGLEGAAAETPATPGRVPTVTFWDGIVGNCIVACPGGLGVGPEVASPLSGGYCGLEPTPVELFIDSSADF